MLDATGDSHQEVFALSALMSNAPARYSSRSFQLKITEFLHSETVTPERIHADTHARRRDTRHKLLSVFISGLLLL